MLTRDHKPVAPQSVGDEYRMPVGWRGRGQVNGETRKEIKITITIFGEGRESRD